MGGGLGEGGLEILPDNGVADFSGPSFCVVKADVFVTFSPK